jgi:hypothetical protein
MSIEIVQPFVPALRRNTKYYNLISRIPKKFNPTIKNNNLMKVITACLLLCITVQSLHKQRRLPIIDMHLHAAEAGANGPSPVASMLLNEAGGFLC